MESFEYQIKMAAARLVEFEALRENWDSYGAYDIVSDTIEEARTILHMIEAQDSVLVASDVVFWVIPTVSSGVNIYFLLNQREIRIKLSPVPSKRIVYRIDNYDYYKSPYSRESLEEHFLWLTQEEQVNMLPPIGIDENVKG